MLLLTASCLKALRTMTHPRLLKLTIISLLLNAMALAALVAAVYTVLDATTWLGWLDRWLDWGLTGIAAIVAYFIYPIVLPLVVSLFDDAIANATEQTDYPEVPTPVPPFWPTLAQDARFVLKAVALNLLVLPLYLLPGVNVLLYYLLNGYLLGKEFFRVVAGRHMTQQAAQEHWIRHRISLMGAGMAVAFCATIPIVNLFAPVWAVVMMAHLLHQSSPTYKASGGQKVITHV